MKAEIEMLELKNEKNKKKLELDLAGLTAEKEKLVQENLLEQERLKKNNGGAGQRKGDAYTEKRFFHGRKR